MKKIRYILEFVITWLMIRLFALLGVKRASSFGSFLAKLIGKRHSVNELARRNMKKALPELSDEEVEENLDKMWDNLGRIVGEYCHIAKENPRDLVEKYVTLDEKSQRVLGDLKRSGKGGLIFSGHIGNWEVGPKSLIDAGLDVGVVYRPLNNPYVEKMTAKMRGVKMIAKSSKGGREIIDVIKNGGYVVILADQKVSEGEMVQFFHDMAVTATSLARIALKYDVPLIPARCVRLDDGIRFRVEVGEAVEFEKGGDVSKDVLRLTRVVNGYLEEWIRGQPGQWFWVHDRWKR